MTLLEILYYCFPRTVHSVRVRGNDNYEEHMELLPALCHSDRLSLDVGAKTGMYTRRIIPHSGATMAFEPIRVLSHMLRCVFRNLAQIERVALSDEEGSAVLRTPFKRSGKPRYGLSTIDSRNPLSGQNGGRVREVQVNTRRLDDYALSGVGFIKIDVEGHEMCVLRGARDTLIRERPNLLVEAHEDHHAGAVEKVRAWLQDLGYRGFFLRDHQLVSIDRFDHHTDQRRDGIENFMFIHESCPEAERGLNDLVEERFASVWMRDAVPG